MTQRPLIILLAFVFGAGFNDGCDCGPTPEPCHTPCRSGTQCDLNTRTCVPGNAEIDTQLTGSPQSASAFTDATFQFVSNFSGATFQCSLDSGAYEACQSPHHITVAGGQHQFSVRAVKGGSVDPTPATYTWTVDTTGPDTTITRAPVDTGSTGIDIPFMANEPVTYFMCKFDDEEAYRCTESARRGSLALGQHTFSVYAVDRAGNKDETPATVTWTVLTTTPYVCGPVWFTLHNAILTQEAKACLDQAALELKQDPSARGIADGHRHSTEAPSRSMERAQAVINYWITVQGIDPSRVTARDIGYDCPHASQNPGYNMRATIFKRAPGQNDADIVESCDPVF